MAGMRNDRPDGAHRDMSKKPSKHCRKCDTTKSVNQFYRDRTKPDGRATVCKDCRKVYASEYIERPGKREERRRNTLAWRRRNHQQYREISNRCRARWVQRHREQLAANRRARAAIASGELVRQPCEVRGSVSVEAHHDDYSRPLDVRWLCTSHHRELHAQETRK